MKKTYDVLVIGPVSLDHNIDYLGNERRELGGSVVASGFAAAKSGSKPALFTKLNSADADVEDAPYPYVACKFVKHIGQQSQEEKAS